MAVHEHIQALYMDALHKHLEGDLSSAERLYREIISQAPDAAQAKHYLGFLLQQTDRLTESVALLTAAIALENNHAEWHFNLGITLARQDLKRSAINAYTKAIAIDPDKYFYWTNLGSAFESCGELDRAEQCYSTATKIDANCPDAFYLLSALYLKQERYTEARHSNYCGIIAAPATITSRIMLAQAYYELGRIEDAVAVLENWLLAEPDNPVARHLITAYRGLPAPEKCAVQYVEQTFDAFANSFDTILGRLKYCGPQLVHEYVAGLTPAAANLDVLDLGCGTGLVGEMLSPYAGKLVGVDLSQAMLDQAAIKQIYHQLHKADICDYLSASNGKYDLITCMDTFIYLGQLDELLAQIYRQLKPAGILIFSTETLIEANALGYQLNISGRYSHHPEYLTKLLCNTGFLINNIHDVPIRTESGCPTPGQFVCVIKPD
ncbi:tetratricopeptide repeat protein [Sulfuriferula thiophila]|uniref:tetratricopeptide repeat protein n=1 Tax=Sulfuriferula thiophila TaxID=1781211 RepID=UPI000F60EBF7|nr:tetratricopeptide repeat protein [Sulfuriferula thiophila]